ncbi:MAG: TadG family pilus assembly protein [Pseudomonadota bacterium]
MCSKVRRCLSDRSGSVSLITAIGIFVLLGFIALALDVAHIVMVKSELQKAADAGAMAGARGLWPLVLPVTGAITARNPDCAAGSLAAQLTAHNNRVDGSYLVIDSEITVELGRWDYALKTFTAGCTTTSNAVRVGTLRNGVIMLFAKIFGISTTNLSATATAVMDFAAAVGKGCLPIVLDKNYTSPGTQITIKMTTDNTDNAGWFVLPPDSASAATLKDYVNRDNCPPLKIGDIINLQNGADASVLAAIKDELNTYHPNGWDTFLPVVDTPKPNQQQPVVAFVPFRITLVVNTTSAKRVEGYVLNILDMPSALPGGPNYGALAPPKAVR